MASWSILYFQRIQIIKPPPFKNKFQLHIVFGTVQCKKFRNIVNITNNCIWENATLAIIIACSLLGWLHKVNLRSALSFSDFSYYWVNWFDLKTRTLLLLRSVNFWKRMRLLLNRNNRNRYISLWGIILSLSLSGIIYVTLKKRRKKRSTINDFITFNV